MKRRRNQDLILASSSTVLVVLCSKHQHHPIHRVVLKLVFTRVDAVVLKTLTVFSLQPDDLLILLSSTAALQQQIHISHQNTACSSQLSFCQDTMLHAQTSSCSRVAANRSTATPVAFRAISSRRVNASSPFTAFSARPSQVHAATEAVA